LLNCFFKLQAKSNKKKKKGILTKLYHLHRPGTLIAEKYLTALPWTVYCFAKNSKISVVGSAVRRKQAVLMAKPNEKKFRLTRLSI
jgi:hypothetical protein